MKNLFNLTVIGLLFLGLILGCSGTNKNTSAPNAPVASIAASNTVVAPAAPSEKLIAIQARVLTKEYDDNELVADGKYKGKMLAVSGKIENIAETLGNVTVSLAGHDMVKSVMCSFDESEKEAVAKLKKGQQITLTGQGDGMTMGFYAGIKNCKIQ